MFHFHLFDEDKTIYIGVGVVLFALFYFIFINIYCCCTIAGVQSHRHTYDQAFSNYFVEMARSQIKMANHLDKLNGHLVSLVQATHGKPLQHGYQHYQQARATPSNAPVPLYPSNSQVYIV